MRKPRLNQINRAVLAVAVAGAALFACPGARAAPLPNSALARPAGSAPPPAPAASPDADPALAAGPVAGFMDPFDYDPRGRRDPFVQPSVERPLAPGGAHGPMLPLQRFDLGELKLTGVIWDVKRPRALIETPDKTTHVVGLNAKLGPKNGYIATIREGEIVVVETEDQNGKLSSTSTVVKITTGSK